MRGLKGFFGIRARVAGESVAMAAESLGRERARTALSLAGVCIGIFCIVASMTLFDSLHRSLREGMDSFGADALFIEKMPLEPDLDENGIFRWWKYIGRPEPTYREYLYLKDHCRGASELTFSVSFGNGKIIGVTDGWRCVVPNPISEGRGFLPAELSRGTASAVAGASVELPDGRSVEVGGVRIPVTGILKKGGVNAVSIIGDIDGAVLVPYLWLRNVVPLSGGKATITARPADGVSEEDLEAELTVLLKRFRRVPEGADKGFAVNSMSFIANEISSVFRTVGMVGWIIGLFSLLIGGFGIANIMFVSVAERVGEIGLQKALGATRKVILLQYLAEAAFLSVVGALAGIALVMLLCAAIPSSAIELTVSARTALLALAAALLLGTASGLAPALRASSLPPVEALSK